MREVAALADVSLKTVSRVVNGERTVDPEFARRVREAIDMLGYRRDDAASALRRADRVSSSIGIVFEDVANPFLSYVHRGIEDVARARGVWTFAASADERSELERELALALCARRIDGLIIVPAAGADHSYLARERDAGISARVRGSPAGVPGCRHRALRQCGRHIARGPRLWTARPSPDRVSLRPDRALYRSGTHGGVSQGARPSSRSPRRRRSYM